MKSKTSCFNRTIFKKNFTHYWPLWGLYLVYLLLLVPVSVWQKSKLGGWYSGYSDRESVMYSLVERTLETALHPGPVFLIVAVMALAVFSYLYAAKSANMMHALPVSRLELFVTNYLSGFSFMALPELFTFLITVLVCLGSEITCIQYLLMAFILRFCMIFFAYSLAVFVTMFTGHILAMPAYFLIVNYLYIGCVYIVTCVEELLCYGVTDDWNPGKMSILSPIYYLGNNLWVRRVYDHTECRIVGLEFHGMYLVGIYAAASVLFVAAAYRLYRVRRVETAGDVVSIGVIKPVFRWGMAACGGFLISLAVMDVLETSHRIRPFPCFAVCVTVAGFVLFFAAQMLIVKNFRVFQKRRLLEWCCFTVAVMAFVMLFGLDIFGLESRVPETEDIDAAFVCMDYPVQIGEEEFAELTELHRQIIQNKKEYRRTEWQGEGYCYVTLRYYLKDGTKLERCYPVPAGVEDAQGEDTPAGRIIAWELRAESLKQELLGRGYRANEYISGYIDLYNSEGAGQNYVFSKEELAVLVAAVERDIEEGNYDRCCLTCLQTEETKLYYNTITLEYFNPEGMYDVWEYYSGYRQYAGAEGRPDKTFSASVYLTFGPECRHTIAALEKSGAVSGEYRLETFEEYQLRTAYEYD